MGEMVEFKSNGGTCTGYLAGTSGPGVIVIQEWWGLVPHITDIADRFAAEGFVALAPDMYHGEMTDEPDMAGKLLMSMNLATAGKISVVQLICCKNALVAPKLVSLVSAWVAGSL